MIIKVPTFTDEFKPIIKALNRALDDNCMVQHFTEDEYGKIVGWLDEFKSLALEFTD